ncbi:MAG: HAD-IIB family hydrolase [Synechococcaceae cyanobacterium]|nr:HAD-IIB family hydrolase [Synechococcaceae cyanobacterium]
MPDFLLCTDLDRTLLPNGEAPESPEARRLFGRVAGREDVHLAYVTGRDRQLVEEAIEQYALPAPDWLIADVGTSLYRVQQGRWQRSADWDAVLDHCWLGRSSADLAPRLADLNGLTLQEPAKQSRHKLSFYHVLEPPSATLRDQIQLRLRDAGIAANLIFSVDEAAGVGLLDILPAMADKLRAVRFLIEQHCYSKAHTLFAGDSGNDLEILVSDIPSVIVANAQTDVILAARQLSKSYGATAQLYVATGGFKGMNGNYAAGILEGLVHFYPQLFQDMD